MTARRRVSALRSRSRSRSGATLRTGPPQRGRAMRGQGAASGRWHRTVASSEGCRAIVSTLATKLCCGRGAGRSNDMSTDMTLGRRRTGGGVRAHCGARTCGIADCQPQAQFARRRRARPAPAWRWQFGVVVRPTLRAQYLLEKVCTAPALCLLMPATLLVHRPLLQQRRQRHDDAHSELAVCSPGGGSLAPRALHRLQGRRSQAGAAPAVSAACGGAHCRQPLPTAAARRRRHTRRNPVNTRVLGGDCGGSCSLKQQQ